jgi:DNA-binding MarR family transcriptional regulator
MATVSKEELVGELISRYRAATSMDAAFDRAAAAGLGVSATDLHCLNIVENRNGLTAGELAAESGLTTGAVTAVIDRLERAGFARRAADPRDRRKVKIEVTPAFYERAAEVWGPLAEDWRRRLAARFTSAELKTITAFLATAEELTARHADRVRET